MSNIGCRPGVTEKQRFEEKFIPEPMSGCWLWEAGITNTGYGAFWQGERTNKTALASRASYEIYKGIPPDGYEADHLCRNRMCVNPDHLEAVPKGVNVLRGMGACAKFARMDHCAKGHSYAETGFYKRSDGGRRCKVCDKNKTKVKRDKKKEMKHAK